MLIGAKYQQQYLSAQWRLWFAWADPCPGWSESSLGAHAILWVLSCGGSFFFFFFFVLRYFWINFELSISVDATFYGVTISMDQTTQAWWLVGRISCRGSGKHPQVLDLGCVPGLDEDPSSLWPIHWDLFPFPPEVRCTLSLTLKCYVLPETYDNIKIHTFVYRRRVVSLSKTLYSPKVLVNYPGSDGSVPIWLKIVDWDVKPQHKQPTNIHLYMHLC